MKKSLFIIFFLNPFIVFTQILPYQLGVHRNSPSGGAASGSRTFTNCSKTGKYGPNQTECNTAYSGTNLNGEVTVNNGIQEWTVPSNGTYTIIAYGAQGGGPQGGLGAK